MSSLTRRRFLAASALSATIFTTRGAFAEALAATPRMTEGPFYPDKLPLDTDNDLLILNDSITPALGEVTHLSGRILDAAGNPVRNAFVEIWQVDGNGAYLHSADPNAEKRDSNFQGYGRFLTGSSGEYYFRTIKPVPYPGRTPHIHFAVSRGGKRICTTQAFIAGHPQNLRDGIFRRLSPADRKLVAVDFKPVENSKLGELAANFSITLGHTPEDPKEGEKPKGIAPAEFQRRRRS